MNENTTEQAVIELLGRARTLDGTAVRLVPAVEHDLAALEQAHGLQLPTELSAWFKQCNGAPISPGGLYSLFSGGKSVSVDWHLREYPDWKHKGWIPIAGDGCGDVYVMATRVLIESTGTHPVCFVDQSDFDKLDYAVASGIWKFLYFLLESEALRDLAKPAYWPFDKSTVLAQDPSLAECKDIPLPWEADQP